MVSDANNKERVRAASSDAYADRTTALLDTWGYEQAKRLLDILGALAGILLCLPLWAIAAVLIKLETPGPVFFVQRRPGRNQVPFGIIKLRTMVVDAERRLGEVLAMNGNEALIQVRNDPRTTRVGRVLRKLSIDETPQFINVLKGEMSLIGPRPISRPIADPRNAARLRVAPGITGLWQVSGRKDTTTDFMLTKDIEYLRRRSLLFDMHIAFRTFSTLLKRNGAR
jgi:lipopolysaccharide/colanic/teichoic acid biosynthesis glycosyltransferase